MDNPLFSSGDDWQNNARVNCSHAPMRFYIDGYKRAADFLAQNVVETAIDQDILVYPIAFLYRQYIELQLKDLIRESRILLDEGSSFPNHHNIKQLWELANQLMKKIIMRVDKTAGDYITKDDLAKIDEAICNFVDIDPESFAFRYSEDRDGKNTMQRLTHINIRRLAEHINELAERLEKFDLVVGLLRERQSDSESDLASM